MKWHERRAERYRHASIQAGTAGFGPDGLREWQLGRDPLRLCVPDGHRLARAERCTMAELRDEAWIVCPASTIGRLTKALCVSAGFGPELAAITAVRGVSAQDWGAPAHPGRFRPETMAR